MKARLQILLFLLAFALVCVLARPCKGAQFYVSPTGSDSAAGTLSAPWQHIGWAVTNATPHGGDTVYLRAGTYNEDVYLSYGNSGSAGNYCTVSSYQNENATIAGNGTGSYGVLEVVDLGTTNWVSWIRFIGSGTDGGQHLTISSTTDPYCGYVRKASSIWFEGIQFTGATADGLKFLSWNQDSTTSPPYNVNDDGGPKFCVVTNCSFFANSEYGIKLTGWGTRSNTITGNLIHHNGAQGTYGMNVSGGNYVANEPSWNLIVSNVFAFNTNSGLQMTYVSNIVVVGNTCYSNGNSSYPGRGISLGTACTSCTVRLNFLHHTYYYGFEMDSGTNNDFSMNTCWSNYPSGAPFQSGIGEIVVQAAPNLNLTLYNNTLVSAVNGIVFIGANTGMVASNNLVKVYGNGVYCLVDTWTNAALDYNLFDQVGSAYGFVTLLNGNSLTWPEYSAFADIHGLNVDPQFKTEPLGDFGLLGSSPAIAAGINAGFGLDVGAYPYIQPVAPSGSGAQIGGSAWFGGSAMLSTH